MRELIKKVLLEYVNTISESYRNVDPFGPFIRAELEKIYRPLGKWGQAPNPNDDCKTGMGVINIFPHSEQDVWSVLNRFDTNSKVRTEMKKLFLESNPDRTGDQEFQNWISQNANDLLGPKGKYTKGLVDMNMSTIISGNRNEEFAVNTLKQKFPDYPIKRFCSGDIRDTKKGIDIVIQFPQGEFTVQVKPFTKIRSFVDFEGDTFFEVNSYKFDPNKYSPRNVSSFMFVNSDSNNFIIFDNIQTKIGKMRNDIVRFYEPPLYTNMQFETEKKRPQKNKIPAKELFGIEDDIRKNLEFRKSQIDRLLQNKQSGKSN